MKEYRYIGSHAVELEGGRPLAPGEYTGPIEEKATHNAILIEDGMLVEVDKGTADRVDLLNAAALGKGGPLTADEWNAPKTKLMSLANNDKKGDD